MAGSILGFRYPDLTGTDLEKLQDRHPFLEFFKPGSKDISAHAGLPTAKLMSFMECRELFSRADPYLLINRPTRAQAALGANSG